MHVHVSVYAQVLVCVHMCMWDQRVSGAVPFDFRNKISHYICMQT